MEVDQEIILRNIKNFLKFETTNVDGIWYSKEHDLQIKVDNLRDHIHNLNDLKLGDTELYGSKYFEKLVSVDLQNIPFSVRLTATSIFDKETDINYSISRPSAEYILASFFLFFEDNYIPNLFSTITPSRSSNIRYKDQNKSIQREMHRNISRSVFRYKNHTNIDLTLEKILNRCFTTSRTITIESEDKISLESFNKLYSSFLFSLNYINIPFVEFRNIESKIKGPKRLELKKLNPPRRIYDKEPLYYYQQALSTDNPILKFLSYYQVLEYFYSRVSKEDLNENIKLILTHPEFSSENDKMIKDLVKTIRNTEYRYKEEFMLQLVLKRYLDNENLMKDLKDYDLSYYNHVMNENMEFVEVPNLTNPEDQNFIKKLSNRIYKIRNSLIHSKEGEKHSYVPFSEHESKLRNELPLMRLIAEQVIIKSSERLNLKILEANNHED